MSALRVIYQDDGHQPETHDGEGARVVLEVGSFFLPHRDALLHLRTRERGSDSCGRGLLALVAVRRHTAAAMTAPVTWQLWAWTAAAGRTSCVLKGQHDTAASNATSICAHLAAYPGAFVIPKQIG